MTIPVQRPRKIISGSGWANPLVHDYPIENVTDVGVFADSEELTLGVHYSVSGVGDPAGYTVTITNPEDWSPAVWVLDVQYPINQPSDVDQGGQFGARFEAALDRMARSDQVVYERARRSLAVDRTTPLDAEVSLPAAEANSLLGWTSDGTGLENKGSIPQIQIVAANIASIVTTAENIAAIIIAADNKDDISTVAASIGNVNTVAGVAPILPAIIANEDDIDTVAGDIASVVTVAGIAANVVTVAGIASDVTAVAANEADISTVADNIADVQNAHQNALDAATAKEDAETARDFAALWASAPVDETVDDGVNPPGNSAYHWSQVALGAAIPDGSITIAKLSSDVVDLIESNVRYMASGVALPTENVGPIFHEDYGCILTWQVFDANGADYEGYASEEIGMLADDGRSTPRRGWLERNGATLAKADFPALWNWALHVGQTVALGTWAVGKGFFAEVDTDNFKLPDTRGWFKRPFSNGASMDSGRAWGSTQDDQNTSHTHTVSVSGTAASAGGHGHTVPVNSGGSPGNSYGAGSSTAPTGNVSTSSAGAHTHSVSASGTTASDGGEGRPNNTTTLDVIKF